MDSATQRANVRRYLSANTSEHVDPKTGEVNLTLLAESAAQRFDLYEDDADATIPEWVFDMAVEVAEQS